MSGVAPVVQRVLRRSSTWRVGHHLRTAAVSLWSLNRSATCLHIVAAVTFLAYIFLYVNLPTFLFPGAGHDDGLYIYHASYIVSGQWLGPYSQFTLMKGPGYPLFLAAVSLFRIPVPLAHSLLWGSSIWLLSYSTYKLFRSSFFSLVVFEVAIWNFGPHSSRVIRDEISTPQILLVFALLLLALFVLKKSAAVQCAVLSGLIFGWFWITREEGIVTLPALLVLFASAFHQSFRNGRSVKQPSLVAAGFVTSFILVLGVVASVNLKVYGTFSVVDINGPFKSALEALESVQADAYVPFASVSKTARARIYTISPTFAQLRPFIEGPSSPIQGWKAPSCSAYPNLCGDYATGWFMWALRDAVAFHGDYSSARASSTFYRRLHDEVSGACHTGVIACYHNLLPYMPHINRDQWLHGSVSMETGIEELSFVKPPALTDIPSLGTEDQVRASEHFLGVELHTAPPAEPDSMFNPAVTDSAARYRLWLVQIYSRWMPDLLITGLGSMSILLLRCLYQRTYSPGFAIACAAWLMVICRLVALTLIDISAFPAIFHMYIGYSFIFAGFASLLSIAMLVSWLAKSLDWYGLVTSSYTS